jgi:hypothetical protein
MADTPRKLLIKPNDRVVVLHAPGDAAALLGPLPDGATLATKRGGEADVAVVFSADLPGFTKLIPTLREYAFGSRAVWVGYPKLSSKAAGSLSRDVIRTTLDSTDITTVTQIAIDETWSAIRLRPLAEVGR